MPSPPRLVRRPRALLGDWGGRMVMAECVEQAAQRDRPRLLGCHLGQGYLFARPLDAAAMADLLASGAAAPG